MAVLETIRVKFGIVITVLIAVALLSFIIDPTTLQSVSSSMSDKYDVGNIDGKAISYNDFQAEVDKFTTINEISTGSSASSAEQQTAIRNAAWQSLIDQYLFVKNAKKAGLNVGSEEMVAMMSGEMDSPVFTQNATFFDETGKFSKQRLLDFVEYVTSDETGRLKIFWDYLQNTAINQEYYEKYMSLFTQSNIVNPLMLSEQIADNNNTFNVEFVMVPFGFATDSTIVVSDKEIKAYYESHKKFFKQPASRDIEYVVFEVVPSAADYTAANQALVEVYNEFAATENMKSFLLANSDRQYDAHWYKAGELNSLSSSVNDFVFNGKEAVSSVIAEGESFYAVRVLESANVPEQIQVKYAPANSENLAEALAAAEAEWIPQTPGFEDLMTLKKGEQATINGLVFQVVDTKDAAPRKRVAVLEKKAVAGKETVNEYYSKANTLATMSAGKYESFKKAVDSLGVYAHPVNKMLESANRLGSVEDTKEVTRWVFDSKVGQVSNIITVNNNYFIVAALKGISKEGYMPVKDVASSIKSVLYSEKASEKKAAEVAEKIAGLDSMEAIAEALGTTVSTKDGVAFSSMTSQGLDPKFIGAASVAEDGKISGPVAGSIGVYVYKVTGRDTGAFYTEEDAKTREAQVAQYATQMVVPTMSTDADVKDNRARFF